MNKYLEKIFIPLDLRQKIINGLILKEENYWQLFVDVRLI